MDPSLTMSHLAESNLTRQYNTYIRADNRRRTRSFPSSTYLSEDTPLQQAIPCGYPGRVPFSWEQLPGIPKNIHIYKNDNSTLKVQQLPLPPPPPKVKTFDFEEIGIHKRIFLDGFRRDPFFAALVECSKNDRHDQDPSRHIETRTTTISNRFGLIKNLVEISYYTSCKRTCGVTESIVHLPRSSNKKYF